MPKVLSKKFFGAPAEHVAKNLLGKFLVRQIGSQKTAVRINELEIYDGFDDLASHASRGKTDRNKIMFEEGGYFYVYLVYGMYHMINIVVGKKDYPSAILLRGGELPFSNSPACAEAMADRHELENGKLKTEDYKSRRLQSGSRPLRASGLLTILNGPGKLSRFLNVGKEFNEKIASPEIGLWFEDRGETIKKFRKMSRIGVGYAGPVWSKKKWRYISDNIA